MPFVAAIFVLSGFAALTYQVAWQRALFGIYGLNVESVTVVVTAFMLGLGLGSLAGGWVAVRAPVSRLAVFAVWWRRRFAAMGRVRWGCSVGLGISPGRWDLGRCSLPPLGSCWFLPR